MSSSESGSDANASDAGKALGVSFGINAAIGVVILVVFELCRRYYPDLYNRRWVLEETKDVDERLKGIPLISWCWSLRKYWRPSWIEKHRGIDAALFIRFQYEMVLLFTAILVLCLIVIAPINWAGDNKFLPSSDPLYMSGIMTISMANLSSGSELYWAHGVVVFVIALMGIGSATRLQRAYLHAQRRLRDQSPVQTRSLVVRLSRKVTVEELRRRFESLYVGEVSTINIVRYNEALVKLWAKEQKLGMEVSKLDQLIAYEATHQEEMENREIAAREREHSRSRGCLSRCRGRRDEQDPEVQQQQQQTEQQQQAQEQPQAQASNTSVDSTKKKKTNPEKLSDSNGKLTKVRHEIIEQQNNSPGKSTGVAFVTFKTVEAASKCFDHRNLQTLKPMKIKSVARREAINWNYLHVRGGKKLAMWAISMGVFIFILLFWIIPVTAIQTLGNLRHLATQPGLFWITSILNYIGPTCESFLAVLVPSVLLAVLMSLVVPVIRTLAMREGHFQLVDTDRVVHVRYLWFVVVNVLFASAIAGSIMTQIQPIMDGQISIVNLMAASIPRQGPFFVSYLLVNFCRSTLNILGIGGVIMLWINRYLSNLRGEQFIASYRPAYDYPVNAASDLLIALISLVYAVQFPFILIFTFGYFVLSCAINVHNVVYVNCPPYESDGALWPRVTTQLLAVLVVFQLVMIALLALSGTNAYILPLISICITFTYVMWLIVYSYRHKGTHYGSLEDRRQGNPPTTNNTHAPSSTLNITVLADEDDYDCLGRMRVDRPDLDPIYYIEPILRPVAQLTQRQGFSNQDDDATRTPASEHPKDVKLDQDDNSTKFARAGSSANDAASTTISIPVMAADVSNSASSESSTSYFDSSSIRSSATEPTSAAEPQQ